MDGSRFDAWTRRRFGLAAGSLAVSLLSLSLGDAAAKKRCRKLGKTCDKGGKPCCGALLCDKPSGKKQKHCCKTVGKTCTNEQDCCAPLGCCGLEPICSEICLSDRALKTNFGSVDAADVLQRVRELPVTTWSYTADPPAVRHIGPMAQDFAALFGVGSDDRHLHPLDGQGVTLAAIQGLAAELDRLRHTNQELAARLDALEPAAP